MVELSNITVKYRKNGLEFTALDNVDLHIMKGDFCSVIGPSGSGKSTLLNVIGALRQPDSGIFSFDGREIYRASETERGIYRRESVGFIFQQFHLVPYLNVVQNIRLACYRENHYSRIDNLIEECSLTNIRMKMPGELSVGEKQRVAFIRAIISDPEILLADEPTGNLDPVNSKNLMALMKDFNSKGGTVLLVTHDATIAAFARTSYYLDQGRFIS